MGSTTDGCRTTISPALLAPVEYRVTAIIEVQFKHLDKILLPTFATFANTDHCNLPLEMLLMTDKFDKIVRLAKQCSSHLIVVYTTALYHCSPCFRITGRGAAVAGDMIPQ